MKITWSCVNGTLGYMLRAKIEAPGTEPFWLHEPLGQIDNLTVRTKRELIEWGAKHLTAEAGRHTK